MSILVTGGAGSIGSNICRRLAEQSREVVAYDVVPASRNSVLTDVLARVQVETGSITDLSNLLRVIKARKVEGIIHCAAIVAIPSNQRPVEALEVNIIGTANILEAARITGLGRVVVLSSSSVMGAPQDLVTPRKEDDISLPLLGIYRLSKLTCEQLVYTYRQLFKVDTIAVRPRTVFGPGSIGKSSWPLMQVIEAAVAGRPIEYERGGDTAFDFTYVKDSARGVMQAYDCKSPRYYLYNLSFGQNRTISQACDILKKLFPNLLIKMGPGFWGSVLAKGEQSTEPFVTQRPPQDITRAREDFGFKPEWDLDRLIPDYIRWIKEGKYE